VDYPWGVKRFTIGGSVFGAYKYTFLFWKNQLGRKFFWDKNNKVGFRSFAT
jgi:hypothetical protein